MSLTARNRIAEIDILQVDYEYCTISYYAEGSRDNLGQPSRTLTQRATNVKCSIDPLVRLPTYIRQSGLRETLRQGMIEQSTYFMIVAASQTIEPGDLVTDYDDTTYDVLHVVNWHTHKEAFLRKIN